jgi:hypothetical protein
MTHSKDLGIGLRTWDLDSIIRQGFVGINIKGFKTLNGQDFWDLKGFRTLGYCIGHDFGCMKGARTQWHYLVSMWLWAWAHEHDRIVLKYFNDMDDIFLDYSLPHKLESKMTL